MTKPRIDNVYIAEGLSEDFEELFLKCLTVSKLSFEKFSEFWRELDFVCIFHGRPHGSEMAELTEEALHIAKFFMVANIDSNFEKSVAGLFLIYAILKLQPYRDLAPLRVVQEDVPAIKKLEQVARRERRHDILYILGEVIIRGPCHFHVSARERGLEYYLRKYFDGHLQHSLIGRRPTGVFHRHNEELDIIRELSYLEDRYDKAKMKITGLGSSEGNIQRVDGGQRSLRYADTRLAKELHESLRRIVDGIAPHPAARATTPRSDVKKPPPEPTNTVSAIKKRAMKNAVDAIRHLTGVDSRETVAKKIQEKSAQCLRLLQTPPRKSDSKKSPTKSPKPYPWILKIFNDTQESEVASTSQTEPVIRTSPRKKPTETNSDKSMMIIEIEPPPPEVNKNTPDHAIDNRMEKTLKSPRKRVSSRLSFEDCFIEDRPVKKPRKQKESIETIINNTEPNCIEVRIDERPIEFSAADDNVEIEFIDQYKGRDEKKIIKFDNPKRNVNITKEKDANPMILNSTCVGQNEASTSVANNVKYIKLFKIDKPDEKIIKMIKERLKMDKSKADNSKNSVVIENPNNSNNEKPKDTNVEPPPILAKKEAIRTINTYTKRPKAKESIKEFNGDTTSKNESLPSTSKITSPKHLKATKVASRLRKIGVADVAGLCNENI